MSDDNDKKAWLNLTKKELLEKSLESTMEMTRFMKTEMCKDRNGTADLNPFCVFGLEIVDDEGDERLGGAVIEMELENGENPVEMLPKMLSDIHEKGIEKFLWVMFVCEGYAETDPKKVKSMADDDGTYEYGSLEQDFHNNPTSTVQEGLIATCFSWTGESAVYQQPYKYDDFGIPEYLDKSESYSEEEMNGRIPNIFARFIKYCQLAQLSENN